MKKLMHLGLMLLCLSHSSSWAGKRKWAQKKMMPHRSSILKATAQPFYPESVRSRLYVNEMARLVGCGAQTIQGIDSIELLKELKPIDKVTTITIPLDFASAQSISLENYLKHSTLIELFLSKFPNLKEVIYQLHGPFPQIETCWKTHIPRSFTIMPMLFTGGKYTRFLVKEYYETGMLKIKDKITLKDKIRLIDDQLIALAYFCDLAKLNKPFRIIKGLPMAGIAPDTCFNNPLIGDKGAYIGSIVIRLFAQHQNLHQIEGVLGITAKELMEVVEQA